MLPLNAGESGIWRTVCSSDVTKSGPEPNVGRSERRLWASGPLQVGVRDTAEPPRLAVTD
jgi:hypothetical protein